MAVPVSDELAALADRAQLRRVHLVAWRDREDPEAGGSEEHAAQLAAHWAAAGLDVTIRTSAAPGLPPDGTRDGYRVMRRGGRFTVFPRTVLAELTGRVGPHDGVVDVFHGIPFFSPVWERGPRVGFVHHVHLGTWHLLMPPGFAQVGHVLERWMVPLVYRRATLVTPSEATRREVIERLHLRQADIRVAPNGVDPRFSPGGARSTTPTVAAVGRLMPQKGFDRAIRALARAHEAEPGFEAVIVGDGPSRAELETQVDGLGARSWIRFTGRVDDDALVDHYRSAWLVVNASLREGWGLTLTEAGACGTPAVASRIPGHDEAVVDGATGLLVDGEEQMAAAVVELLRDDERRERLGQAARAHAAHHTWANSARIVLEALAADAERRRRR